MNFLHLDINHVRTQQAYFLKKLHKNLVAVRPIVSGTGGPTEATSSLLDYNPQRLYPPSWTTTPRGNILPLDYNPQRLYPPSWTTTPRGNILPPGLQPPEAISSLLDYNPQRLHPPSWTTTPRGNILPPGLQPPEAISSLLDYYMEPHLPQIKS